MEEREEEQQGQRGRVWTPVHRQTDTREGGHPGVGLLELPVESCLAWVLTYLEPRDVLMGLALTSRHLHRAVTSAATDLYWAAKFLQRFGSDFWGEAAGPHPYHRPAHTPESNAPENTDQESDQSKDENNPWRRLPPCQVLQEFARAVSVPDHPQATAHQLICRGIEEAGSWHNLYKSNYRMLTAWQKPAEKALIVTGMPNSGKSEIIDFIADFLMDKIYVDQVNPGGKCRVVRGRLPADQDSHDGITVNIMEIEKPRDWYMPKFRGSQALSLNIIYVINRSKLASMKDDKQHGTDLLNGVYRELHGTIGEAQRAPITSVLLLLTSADHEEALDRSEVLELLRIHQMSPAYQRSHCPWFAGPVMFAISCINPHKLSEPQIHPSPLFLSEAPDSAASLPDEEEEEIRQLKRMYAGHRKRMTVARSGSERSKRKREEGSDRDDKQNNDDVTRQGTDAPPAKRHKGRKWKRPEQKEDPLAELEEFARTWHDEDYTYSSPWGGEITRAPPEPKEEEVNRHFKEDEVHADVTDREKLTLGLRWIITRSWSSHQLRFYWGAVLGKLSG